MNGWTNEWIHVNYFLRNVTAHRTLARLFVFVCVNMVRVDRSEEHTEYHLIHVSGARFDCGYVRPYVYRFVCAQLLSSRDSRHSPVTYNDTQNLLIFFSLLFACWRCRTCPFHVYRMSLCNMLAFSCCNGAGKAESHRKMRTTEYVAKRIYGDDSIFPPSWLNLRRLEYTTHVHTLGVTVCGHQFLGSQQLHRFLLS